MSVVKHGVVVRAMCTWSLNTMEGTKIQQCIRT